jgi:DNA-binding PadR family transcriptional regulator
VHFFCILELMSREALGTFELTVMLALMRLDNDSYGVPIANMIEECTGREVIVSSVYAALERLTRKGLVSSQVGESTAERGGRAKRYFRVTAEGVRQVRRVRSEFSRLGFAIP